MSQRKQTARKTTGKHVALTSSLKASGTKATTTKRVRLACPAESSRGGARGKSASARRSGPATSAARSGVPDPIDLLISPIPDAMGLSSLRSVDDVSVWTPRNVVTPMRPRPTPSTPRAPHAALDEPIGVCLRFASWLDTQTYVRDAEVLRALERDGSQLLPLARATVAFDEALRGSVAVLDANGKDEPGSLREHAHTLRVFAELLQSKRSEGSLSEELQTAFLRHSETLLRLARSCLDLDRALRGSDGAT